MQIKPFKTHLITQGECFQSILDTYVPKMSEGSILAVTSKVISLCEGRVIPKGDNTSKFDLIKQECDAHLNSIHDIVLTITHGILIPSAGIDESNVNDAYILYPKDIQGSAKLIWHHICERDDIRNFGVVITDSHTTPLRRGVTGICLGWCGFKPLYSYVGKPDIYGIPLQVTQTNILDALASAAVFVVGEGNEQTPLALITEAPKIEFLDRSPSEEELNSVKIPASEDLYGPLIQAAKWKQKDQ